MDNNWTQLLCFATDNSKKNLKNRNIFHQANTTTKKSISMLYKCDHVCLSLNHVKTTGLILLNFRSKLADIIYPGVT